MRIALDGEPIKVTDYSMGIRRSKSRGTPCALITSGVALLFLVQMLAFIFSPNGRIAFSTSDAGASIAMAGEICHTSPSGEDETPPQPARHHHCTLCSIAYNSRTLDAIFLAASFVVMPAPRSGHGNAPSWSLSDNLPSLPVGWTSSWSSRAPPPIA